MHICETVNEIFHKVFLLYLIYFKDNRKVNFSSDFIIHIFVVFVNILHIVFYDSFVNCVQREENFPLPAKEYQIEIRRIINE